MTEKGSDAGAKRDAARQRGICPAIPPRRNARDRPWFFPEALYRRRARIEQTVGKLKRFKRIALRCEKTARNSAVRIAFACGFIFAEAVHTAGAARGCTSSHHRGQLLPATNPGSRPRSLPRRTTRDILGGCRKRSTMLRATCSAEITSDFSAERGIGVWMPAQ